MSEEEYHNTPVENVPVEAAKLVGPYIKRGKELATVQPLISYYCYLYAAQLILESQLHLKYEDIANYIEILLNTIEENRKKIEDSGNKFTEILTDKEKSFKLVLGFSLSIFNKCVNEIENHTTTKKTVQNFMAFLNFIEVVKLWPELYTVQESEIKKQIKYSKFHLSRILKAFKTNTDPNDYITGSDEKELDELMEESLSNPKDDNEGEDKTDGKMIGGIIEEKSNDPNDSSLSLPEAPSKLPGQLKLPVAPVLIKGQKNNLGLPTAPEFSNTATNISTKPTVTLSAPPTPPKVPDLPPKPTLSTQSNHMDSPEPLNNGRILTKQEVKTIWNREEIISNAQRKAKFAISALNYDDIQTAINELESALKLLNDVLNGKISAN